MVWIVYTTLYDTIPYIKFQQIWSLLIVCNE